MLVVCPSTMLQTHCGECVVASDIYFIGGFGTVAWVDVEEYESLKPDKIAVDGGEQNLKVWHETLL